MKLKNNRILYIMCSALFSLSILSVADASLFLPKPKGKLPFASVPDLSKSTIAFKKNNTNFKPGLTISNRSFSPVKSNPIPNNSKPKINPITPPPVVPSNRSFFPVKSNTGINPSNKQSSIAFKKNNTNFKPGLTISNRSFSPVKSNPIPNNSKPKINPINIPPLVPSNRSFSPVKSNPIPAKNPLISFKKSNTNFKPGLTISNRSFSAPKRNTDINPSNKQSSIGFNSNNPNIKPINRSSNGFGNRSFSPVKSNPNPAKNPLIGFNKSNSNIRFGKPTVVKSDKPTVVKSDKPTVVKSGKLPVATGNRSSSASKRNIGINSSNKQSSSVNMHVPKVKFDLRPAPLSPERSLQLSVKPLADAIQRGVGNMSSALTDHFSNFSGNQVRNGDTLSFFELSFEELFSKIEKGFDEIAVKTLLSYANDISREGNGNCSRHILDQEIFKRIELLERIRAEIQSFIGRLQEDNEGGMVIPEREESKAKFLLSLQEKFDALYEKRSANFSIDAEESVIDIMLVDFVESLRKLTPTSDFKKMDTVGKLYLSRIDKMLDDVNGQLVITEQIHGDESQLLLLLRSTGLQRLKKQMEIFLLLFGPRKDSSVKNSLEEAGVTVNQLEKDYDEICSRLNNEMRTKFCDLIKARDVVLDALGSLFEPSFPELSFETGEE